MLAEIVESESRKFNKFKEKLFTKTVKNNRYLYIRDHDFFTDKIVREYIGPFTEKDEKMYYLFRKYEAKRKINTIKQISNNSYKSEILPDLFMKYMDLIRFLYYEELSQYNQSELEKMQEIVFTKYVQGTTAIEGNTYDLQETHLTLNEGITVTGKEKREFYEIDNYDKWRSYLETIKNPKIETKEFIKKIHEYILKNIEDEQAGRFRKIQVGITGSDWVPSPPITIDTDLDELLSWFHENQTILYPIELIARFHSRFEEIHPFFDGNGRVGREIMRLQLNKFHFPPIFINNSNRQKYLESLKEANNNNYVPIVGFIYNLIIQESAELLTVAKEEITKSNKLLKEQNKKSSKGKEENNKKITKIIKDWKQIFELESEYLTIFENTLTEFSSLIQKELEDIDFEILD